MKELLIIESGIEISHIEWTHITAYQDFLVYFNGDVVITGHFGISDYEKKIVMKHLFNLTMGDLDISSSEIDAYCTLLKAVTKACEKRKEELKTIEA